MPKSIADVIRERGYCVIKPKGTSMFPLIRGRNNDVCIVRAELPLKKYDVPVYMRSDGSLIMHRVLDIDEDGYVCCGDNQWVLERGVKDEQIIGVLDSWYRGKQKHNVKDKSYLRYVKFWCRSIGRRRFILYFCHIYISVTSRIRSYGAAAARRFRKSVNRK